MSELRKFAFETEFAPATSREELFTELATALERSKERLRVLQAVDFAETRTVGRKRLPTTVGGLLVHVAEHTQRHVGQAITTAKIVVKR